MRISDWSSDVCSSDLGSSRRNGQGAERKHHCCEQSAKTTDHALRPPNILKVFHPRDGLRAEAGRIEKCGATSRCYRALAGGTKELTSRDGQPCGCANILEKRTFRPGHPHLPAHAPQPVEHGAPPPRTAQGAPFPTHPP